MPNKPEPPMNSAPKPNTTNSELANILVSVAGQGSLLPRGKTIHGGMFHDEIAQIEALIASKVEEAEKSLEYELNTEQCVKVATYMYEQWQEAMQPPLLIYKDFPTWLATLQSREQDKV